MADVIKYLFAGSLPTSATEVYTVPSGKCSVAKSFAITNSTVSPLTFTLIVGGVNVAYDHTIKAYGTLLINDLDIPLLPGENITVLGSTTSVKMHITGLERDYVASDYPYQKIIYALYGTATTPANNFDAMIKSIVLCNPNSAGDAQVSITLENYLLPPWKVIKTKDSLIIPSPKIFLPKGKQITVTVAGTNTNCRIGFVLEKVGD